MKEEGGGRGRASRCTVTLHSAKLPWARPSTARRRDARRNHIPRRTTSTTSSVIIKKTCDAVGRLSPRFNNTPAGVRAIDPDPSIDRITYRRPVGQDPSLFE